VRGWICLGDTPSEPGDARALAYESLLAAQPAQIDWPELDERDASSLCYTSGTTGNPKGVLYSHRSTVLHAMAICWPDSLNLHAADALCPIVPMFHVNAWGLPYSAALVGCKLVLAGAAVDGASVYQLFEDEGVNRSAGVPTVWLGLLNHMQTHDLKFSTLKEVVFGGAPMAMVLCERFAQLGVDSLHAWGMTEMSPLGSANREKFIHRKADPQARKQLKLKQGRAPFGVDLRIAGPDGAELPHDGQSVGNLQARGLWVLDRYFGHEHSALTADGWFDTGDIATLDAEGYIQITDRAKDVIKSGGEWISSIDLENVAMSFPGVAEAAAIAIPDPKWDERPALVVVPRPGVELDVPALLKFFEGKVARWWIPDVVHLVDALPHNATGKVQKLLLRERFGKG
jgi:fatty-acyl-CoA synthase